MSHLRAFFCREYRDYALFGVEFLAEICQKFSEILRILAEILRKKLATGASGLLCTRLFILSLPYPKFSSMAIKPRFEMLEGNCGDRVDAGQGQFWAPLTTDGPSAGCSCKK